MAENSVDIESKGLDRLLRVVALGEENATLGDENKGESEAEEFH